MLAFSSGLPWQVALFCFAAITVVRIVPVHLSLAGSALTHRERLQVGVLGPRGTTSVVFGLLAFNQLIACDGSTACCVYTPLTAARDRGETVPPQWTSSTRDAGWRGKTTPIQPVGEGLAVSSHPFVRCEGRLGVV